MAESKISAVFSLEKETKNTVRYSEESSSDHPPICNTIYIQKWAIGQLDGPEKIKVTIEPAA